MVPHARVRVVDFLQGPEDPPDRPGQQGQGNRPRGHRMPRPGLAGETPPACDGNPCARGGRDGPSRHVAQAGPLRCQIPLRVAPPRRRPSLRQIPGQVHRAQRHPRGEEHRRRIVVRLAGLVHGERHQPQPHRAQRPGRRPPPTPRPRRAQQQRRHPGQRERLADGPDVHLPPQPSAPQRRNSVHERNLVQPRGILPQFDGRGRSPLRIAQLVDFVRARRGPLQMGSPQPASKNHRHQGHGEPSPVCTIHSKSSVRFHAFLIVSPSSSVQSNPSQPHASYGLRWGMGANPGAGRALPLDGLKRLARRPGPPCQCIGQQKVCIRQLQWMCLASRCGFR